MKKKRATKKTAVMRNYYDLTLVAKRRKKTVAAVPVLFDKDAKEPQAYLQSTGQLTASNTQAGDIIWYTTTDKPSLFQRLRSWFGL